MVGLQHASVIIWILTAFIVLPVFYYINKAKKNKNLYVRRIPGIDAIDETIGRSVEMGRPLFFSTGLTRINPILYACLGVLNHVAKKAAIFHSKLFVPQNDPEVLAIVEDTVRSAYQSENKLSYYDPNSVQFLSGEQFAYAAGYIGLVQREKAGGVFLFGEFAAESLILAEAGQQIGAMQIGATTSPEQVAFFIVSCDYTLIGEELYSSAAYLTKEPIQMGSLYAQDRAKLLIMFIIIAGVICATLNSIFPDLIKVDYEHFWNLIQIDFKSYFSWLKV